LCSARQCYAHSQCRSTLPVQCARGAGPAQMGPGEALRRWWRARKPPPPSHPGAAAAEAAAAERGACCKFIHWRLCKVPLQLLLPLPPCTAGTPGRPLPAAQPYCRPALACAALERGDSVDSLSSIVWAPAEQLLRGAALSWALTALRRDLGGSCRSQVFVSLCTMNKYAVWQRFGPGRSHAWPCCVLCISLPASISARWRAQSPTSERTSKPQRGGGVKCTPELAA
jgi:hypothetical protein